MWLTAVVHHLMIAAVTRVERGRVGPTILLDFVEGIAPLLTLKHRSAFLWVSAAPTAEDGENLIVCDSYGGLNQEFSVIFLYGLSRECDVGCDEVICRFRLDGHFCTLICRSSENFDDSGGSAGVPSRL